MQKLVSSIRRHTVKTVMAFFFFIPATCFPPDASSAAESFEELVGKGELSGDVEKLILLLDELESRNIRINTAGPDELRQLPWLGAADIQEIMKQRKTAPILSLGQLAVVIGKSRAEAIAPYISFEMNKRPVSVKSDEGFSGTFTSRVYRENPPRNGVLNGKYAEAQERLYNRLQLAFAGYTLGFVQERDIGEPELFDYTSFSIGATLPGIVKKAVLGNYELNFGQGLMIGQGRYYTSGADVSGSVRLTSKRLSQYMSSSESGFFQGGAVSLDLKPCELTVFYSANKVDAIINRTSGMITSVDDSGYHRTATERQRKDNVTEKVYGANLLYSFSSGSVEGRIGGSWLRYDYGVPLKKLGGESFSTLAGLEGQATIGRFGFFGEAAWAENPEKVTSWIAGTEWNPMKGVSTLIAFRDYRSGYYAPFASAFAVRGDHAENEKGMYAGGGFRLNERISISGYYDWFRFPLLDDHCQFPSDGHDSRAYVSWKPSRFLSLELQVQHKYKEEEKNQGTGNVPHWTALPKITERCRLDCDLELPGNIRLSTLGEVKRAVKKYLAGNETCNGWLLYEQAGYSGKRFSVKSRFTVFDISDYDAAIYVYEDDLPQTFSMGMYNGRGKSMILLASWEPSKQLRLAGRFEKVWYSGREVYGDGNDQRDTAAPASFHLGAYLKF
jgi:hypothetical protein